MPGLDFNKDLSTYIKRRSTQSDYSYIEKPNEPEPAEPAPVMNPIEPLDTMTEEESTFPRERFFTKVRKFFGNDDAAQSTPQSTPDATPQETDIHLPCREDIKALGKITLEVLHALPDREVVGFKNSDQYAKLKSILSKHNLIKSE